MANRYWVGGTGTWDGTSTSNWSAAVPVGFTASRSGTTLTTTGSPALVVGMTVWYDTNSTSGTYASAGTITGGSGNTWTTSGSGTISSQQMYAATTGASVPVDVDDVFFRPDATTNLTTVTVSGIVECLSFSNTGYGKFAGSGTLYVNDNFTMSAAPPDTSFGSIYVVFYSTTSGRSIYTNGVPLYRISFNNTGGWTLGGNLTVKQSITHSKGTFNTGNYVVNVGTELASGAAYTDQGGANVKSLVIGASGTWNVYGNWDASGTNMTMSAAGQILMKDYTSGGIGSVSFNGGGYTYAYVANTVNYAGGPGQLTLVSANTFTELVCISDATYTRKLLFPNNATTTVGTLTVAGYSGSKLAYIDSANVGGYGAATISKASGTVTLTYTTISWSTATGGATWNAYTSAGNVNAGNNTGWNFSAPPAPGNANFMAFF